jgi:hypothetical protein
MTKQEILDGIDQAINVLLTYEQDEPTEKIIQALNWAWDKVNQLEK